MSADHQQHAEPPVTGDRGVDTILTDLQEALEGDQQDRVDALARAHRQLQERLSEPGPPHPPRPR